MKTMSAELAAHYAQEVTTLATCIKLTRRDSVVMGFTDHDDGITFDGVDYEADTGGFSSTAVAASANMSVDNLEADGYLDSAGITEEDLMSGYYDFAEFEIFQVNYEDLTMGRCLLVTGTLGEVRHEDGKFSAEMRGLSQALQQQVGALYSPDCRANFCDDPSPNGIWRCYLDVEDWTVTGAATSVSGSYPRQTFTDSSRSEAAGYFTYGRLTWTSGSNTGRTMEVKRHQAGGIVTLFEPMTYEIEVGDEYSLVAGCDKRKDTCKDIFDNLVNFRGEPYLPGINKTLDYPDAK